MLSSGQLRIWCPVRRVTGEVGRAKEKGALSKLHVAFMLYVASRSYLVGITVAVGLAWVLSQIFCGCFEPLRVLSGQPGVDREDATDPWYSSPRK